MDTPIDISYKLWTKIPTKQPPERLVVQTKAREKGSENAEDTILFWGLCPDDKLHS